MRRGGECCGGLTAAHDATSASIPDGGAKGWPVLIREEVFGQVDVDRVACQPFVSYAPTLEGVCVKVLESDGHHDVIRILAVSNLHARRPRSAELAHQVRVFGASFTVPTPPWIPVDVDDGTPALKPRPFPAVVQPRLHVEPRARLLPNNDSHAPHEVSVEGCGPRRPARERG
jgi:hypothetical protein